jgi:pimeloyl-ACP methyl ester carboxylesterase
MALLRRLRISSVNMVGHSMGGFVALDCAIRYPENVSKLVLAGTSAFSSKRNNAIFLDWASSLESGTDLNQWFRNIFCWLFTRRFLDNPQ